MLSVKHKLIAGYAVLIVILVASNLLSASSSNQQIATVQELMDEDMPVLTSSHAISLAALEMRRHEKDVLLGIGNEARQREALDRMTASAEGALKGLKELSAQVAADRESSEADRRAAATAYEGLSRYVAFAGAVAREAVGAKAASAGDFNERLGNGKQDFYAFEKAMDDIRGLARRMVADKAREMTEMSGTVRAVQLSALAGGVLAGVVSAVLAVLGISRPMSRLLAYSDAVSSGDLGAHLARTGRDEFSVLGGNIERMVEALRAKIEEAGRMTREAAEEAARARTATQEAQEATRRAETARTEGMSEAARGIEQVVGVVASASRMLLERIEKASDGARDQSERVRDTLEAMHAMNGTVRDVAGRASRAAQSTDKARQEAVSGSAIIAEVVESIGRVRTQAQALKEDMGELGQRAEGIGRIMSVISDIADQTNLLALNAAIEAARAGDAGRGFAVVADEVRKLAEKTMDATREVGEAIRGIQQGTQQNVGNVETAVRTIEKATELAGRSGQALSGILSQVELAADQVNAIAAASGQQASASERISRRIEEVDAISGNTSRSMSESAGEVEELSRQAEALSGLVLAMDSGGVRSLGPGTRA